ncbi:hypothetical protein OZ410_02425 [Robiginitalea sp. M366]|uniref:hypothetical protein n=1 Tax=Robiginitalea aestuariiviva TaxID=3036903 RepID=UPI00240E47B2|nr:hypothetical protein [Robiginitalea aestuariiviva]MDG1571154.1 hypothetical protein [Robiginitalea aestuariiviva]
MKPNPNPYHYFLLFLLLLLTFSRVHAQEENRRFLDDFRGTASITHNGISLVPSFSLGDPALLFDLKFTKGRLSFEPDMRFALEGKPWSFIFWFRYKAIQKERFSLRVGAHPALNFRTVEILRDGQPEELLEARRYLAAELAPNYRLTDKISVGAYYLLGKGFDQGVKTTHFIVLNSAFSRLYLAEKVHMNISPQLYYLQMDQARGVYTVGMVSLVRDGFPLSLSAIFNKAIDTEIQPEKDFIWNVSLVYSFPNPGRSKGTRIQR